MEERKFLSMARQLELGEAEFTDDFIEVCVDIIKVSDNLYSQIIQTMEATKLRTAETMKAFYDRGWNETELKNLALSIMVQKDKAIETKIVIHFEEIGQGDSNGKADLGCEVCELEIDLSGFETELQELIIEGTRNKFFSRKEGTANEEKD